MKVLFLVLTGLIVLSLVGMLSNNEQIGKVSCELHKICTTGLCVCGIIYVINWNTPTAIDVYRGKTTLEITYKDSVAIDSVVVFKNSKQ